MSAGGSKVFVAGFSAGTEVGDYVTAAYTAATGARLWVARYNRPGRGNHVANSVAVSPGGSKVFLTGSSIGLDGSGDLATVAYSA